MLLLVGLGNPGKDYARTRHNIGFLAVDAIADAHGFGPARARFQGLTREGLLAAPEGGERVMILKPQTYMNLSGQAVGEAAQFFKLTPEAVVVFQDELDLPFGTIRAKTGGGAAGHNGIKSIEAALGRGFRRIRIGIGHPGDRERVTGHVLSAFSKAESEFLPQLMDAIARAAPMLAAGRDEAFVKSAVEGLPPVPAPPGPEKE